MKYVVDRIEGNIVILEDIIDGKTIKMPVDFIGITVFEGDIIQEHQGRFTKVENSKKPRYPDIFEK